LREKRAHQALSFSRLKRLALVSYNSQYDTSMKRYCDKKPYNRKYYIRNEDIGFPICALCFLYNVLAFPWQMQ